MFTWTITVDPHDNLVTVIITILIPPIKILRIREVKQNAHSIQLETGKDEIKTQADSKALNSHSKYHSSPLLKQDSQDKKGKVQSLAS